MKTLGIIPPPGLHVRTTELNTTAGFMIVKKHLDARQPNKPGVLGSYVPGHGGDVYWIFHSDGTIGAYLYTEFELTRISQIKYWLYANYYRKLVRPLGLLMKKYAHP